MEGNVFSILLSTLTLYLHLEDLSFLVAALACFLAAVLLANNILLTMEVHRDKLTGLGNKIALHIRLQRELSRIDRNGGYLTFLFFDIDNFKKINDTCGEFFLDMKSRGKLKPESSKKHFTVIIFIMTMFMPFTVDF